MNQSVRRGFTNGVTGLVSLGAALAGLLLAGCQTQPNAVTGPDQVAVLKAHLEAVSTDWANLARYRDANAQLGAPVAGETRVVFMGDSITDAWPRSGHFFAGRDCIGRGISGQTTPQMLVRFQRDVVALQPKVVVILAGTNDIANNTGPYNPDLTFDSLAGMVAIAQANGIRVVLSSVLPAYDYPWRPGLQPVGKIAALNARLRDLASRTGCIYLDYFPTMADERKGLKAKFTQDGVHPNADGYAAMETAAGPAIEAALAAH